MAKFTDQQKALIRALKQSGTQIDPGGAADALANNTFTGTYGDNQYAQVFNPMTGQYETRTASGSDPFEFSTRGDAYGRGTVNGIQGQLIDTSDPNYGSTGAKVNVGDGNLDWTYGATPEPPPAPHTGPLSLGGPPSGVGGPAPGGGGGTTGPGGNTRPDLPQPPGGPIVDWTGEGNQADTSWNWDYFAPKQQGDGAWGGYDQDYQAFERYQPGMKSPWGMPNLEGGNKEFYQQQFVNLLRDEQGYRARQKEAQGIRQDALNDPFTPPPSDQMFNWANGGKGLADVTVGGGQQSTPVTWGLNSDYGITSDMNNRQAVGAMSQLLTPQEQSMMSEHFREAPDVASQNNWLTAGSPQALLGNAGTNSKLSPEFSNTLQKVWNNIYKSSGGPSGPNVPEGYASPIAAGGV